MHFISGYYLEPGRSLGGENSGGKGVRSDVVLPPVSVNIAVTPTGSSSNRGGRVESRKCVIIPEE